MSFNHVACGKRMKELRKAEKMSQMELAEKLHIGRQHVGFIENGERVASIDLYLDIVQLFDVSLDYLITGEDRNMKIKKEIGQLMEALRDYRETL